MTVSKNIMNDRSEILTLITPNDVKTLTPIYANVEESQLKPAIYSAEQLYIKGALGETLYKELLEQFTLTQGNPNLLPDGSTLPNNTNYKQLYQELKLALI
jgi:hypothetical protein